MLTLDALATFFGWCTVLNLALYVFSSVALFSMRGFAMRINRSIFKISEEHFTEVTFDYIARWKLIIITLNFVPYLALKLMLQG